MYRKLLNHEARLIDMIENVKCERILLIKLKRFRLKSLQKIDQQDDSNGDRQNSSNR